MILLIDNYDSFTYNLYQYLGLYDTVQVVRNDQITIEEIRQLSPDKIVISPGPKSPDEAGRCLDIIKTFYRTIPILGICLGHQCIGKAFGAEIVHTKQLHHGKSSMVTHNGRGIFKGVKNPMQAARYHSLAVKEGTLPEDFEVAAVTADGEIMAITHPIYPITGLQFHPESIYTPDGMKLIRNFMKGEKKHVKQCVKQAGRTAES